MLITDYSTEQDKFYLSQFLHFALMHTERIFDPVYSSKELKDYRAILVGYRSKLYEYLEVEDPNKAAIELLLERSELENHRI